MCKLLSVASAILLLGAAACGFAPSSSDTISLRNPDTAEVVAALAQFNEISPAVKTGEWLVEVSNQDVDLGSFEEKTAEELRDLGRLLNTTSRCRKEAEAIDYLTAIMISPLDGSGCRIDQLSASPGSLSYTKSCNTDGWNSRTEVALTIAPDRFETKWNEWGASPGRKLESRARRYYRGMHDGRCSGDEAVLPFFWAD